MRAFGGEVVAADSMMNPQVVYGDDIMSRMKLEVDRDDGEGRTALVRVCPVEGGSFGMFASTGHLLYARDETLLAAPFDPFSHEVLGPATVSRSSR